MAPPYWWRRLINLLPGAGITLDIDPDPGGDTIDITIAASGIGDVSADTIWDTKGDLAVATGADTAVALPAGSNDTILMADSGQASGLKWAAAATTPSTQTFGDAAAGGSADTYSRGDHKHAMMASPVTSIKKTGDSALTGDVTLTAGSNVTLTQSGQDITIEAAGAGGTGAPEDVDYLVGTANATLTNEIVVGTTPGGELGGTWASPTVDATHSGSAHSDFIAKAYLAAKGDLISASADNTPELLTVGSNDTILMADSAAASGLKWAAAATATELADVASSESAGSSDTYARGDHVHAHEAAHIAHDTAWAAKGDLVAGTANDTAQVLSVGTNGQMLTAQSGQTTGLQWAAVFHCPVWSKEGTLATGAGTARWYNDTGRTLTFVSARASVGTAPTGATIIVDVNVDGTTIMTGTKVVVSISANTGEQTTFSTTTIADNSYLTVDIDQVGSTVAGADLTIQVWMSG